MIKTHQIIAFIVLQQLSLALWCQNEPVLAVSAEKVNILYLGIPNPLTIAVEDISAKNVEVKVSNGIVEGKNGKYIVRITGDVDTTIISVFARHKKVASKTYRLRRLADPEISLQDKQSGFLYKDDLLNSFSLRAILNNFTHEVEFEIKGFKMYYEKDGTLTILESDSNTLSPEMIEAIKGLYRDQLIGFREFIVVGPDEIVRNIDQGVSTISIRVR